MKKIFFGEELVISRAVVCTDILMVREIEDRILQKMKEYAEVIVMGMHLSNFNLSSPLKTKLYERPADPGTNS